MSADYIQSDQLTDLYVYNIAWYFQRKFHIRNWILGLEPEWKKFYLSCSVSKGLDYIWW